MVTVNKIAMYTSEDVLEMMDSLPVAERLLVVEETLRKIRVNTSKPTSSSNKAGVASNYSHPVFAFAGIWTEEEADEFSTILTEGDKIDYDEW